MSAILGHPKRKRKTKASNDIKAKRRKNSEDEMLWKNKERVLIFSSRGIDFHGRHLMQDFRILMPHSKPETKMDRKDKLLIINELSEMKNCNKCIYFEAKKMMDLYMWVSNVPHGPSAKFLVRNIHTMAELKLTGNCLKGSRPLLSFDPRFDKSPHDKLLKELFIQIFATPRYHPKSQPFVDHVYSFTIADNHIWFRNYQIIEEDASLVEVGPRMVLNLIKIFQGSFGGPTLYENPHYCSPNEYRRKLKLENAALHRDRRFANQKKSRPISFGSKDPTEGVFVTSPPPRPDSPPETPREKKSRPARHERKRGKWLKK
uniref:Ribosome biogenesis protein BRX1 homolog n=1 Tax=Eptatretus burgeri TaxID=7764 RepID=A0A8C4Q9G2_EPTBU